MLLEKESYDISYCTVSMNRAEHVKKTLTQNIQNNLNNNVEFLLLDYNSKDEWVLNLDQLNMSEPIYSIDCDNQWLWFSNSRGVSFFRWDNYEN